MDLEFSSDEGVTMDEFAVTDGDDSGLSLGVSGLDEYHTYDSVQIKNDTSKGRRTKQHGEEVMLSDFGKLGDSTPSFPPIGKKEKVSPVKRIMGFVVVVLLVLAITAEAEFSSFTVKYVPPLHISFCTTSMLSFCFPIQMVILSVYKYRTGLTVYPKGILYELNKSFGPLYFSSLSEIQTTNDSVRFALKRLMAFATVAKLMALGLLFGFVSLMSYETYNRALLNTSSASLVCIYNSCAVWSFLLSVLLLGEKPTFAKVLSTSLSLIGVIMIGLGEPDEELDTDLQTDALLLRSFSDFPEHYYVPCGDENLDPSQILADEEEENPMVGDLFALITAFLCAGYNVCWKVVVGDPSQVSLMALISSVGMMNFFGLWPVFFLLDYGCEHFGDGERITVPANDMIAVLFTLSSISGLSIVFLQSVGIAITSPLFVVLASMMAIPLCSALDFFVRGQPYTFLKAFGTIMVLIGFAVMNVPFDHLLPEFLRFGLEEEEDEKKEGEGYHRLEQ